MVLFFRERSLFRLLIRGFLKTQNNAPTFQVLQVLGFVFAFVLHFLCANSFYPALSQNGFKIIAADGALNCKNIRRIRLPCYGALSLPPPISCREASLKGQTEENFV